MHMVAKGAVSPLQRILCQNCGALFAAAVFVALLAARSSCAVAQGGGFIVTEENDAFVKHGTDDHYTNGIRVAYEFATAHWWPGFLRRWTPRLAFAENADEIVRKQIADADLLVPGTTWMPLGQNLYTPKNIDSSQLLVGDRPYGAYLYTGIEYHAGNASVYHGIELDVGATGPIALGRETQTRVHEILGIHTPKGWANQIRGEPGVELQYEQRRVFLKGTVCNDYRIFDLVPHAGLSVGNIMTYGAAGATVRIGLNLPETWPTRIPGTFTDAKAQALQSAALAAVRAAMDAGTNATNEGVGARAVRPERPAPASQDGDPAARRWYELYLIGAIEERAVLRNIFLDGNTFDQGYHVTKNTSVFDYDIGVVARVFWLTVSYRRITRSPEFSPGDIPHRFGSITVGLGHPY
jgi:lipid A 3-O-deacylase